MAESLGSIGTILNPPARSPSEALPASEPCNQETVRRKQDLPLGMRERRE